MRVALASLQHETNTYCPGRTRLSDFQIARGPEIAPRAKGTRTALGGWVAGLDQIGAELVGLVAAGATPSGVIEGDAYRALCGELEVALARAGRIDAVALALHGAAVAEDVDDVEADWCERIRAHVGADVPLLATFDLHGNVSAAGLASIDLLFPCREYPHVDTFERGVEAARALPALRARVIRPVTHVERLPMLLPPATTRSGPAARVNALCAEQRARPGVLGCSFFHGFPYADVPLAGASIVASADGDPELARDAARAVASFVWEQREAFRPATLSCVEAVARARALPGGPIVIHETCDNPGGGAPGDGTHLLRAMLEAGLDRACFGCIADPEAARTAHARGVGTKLALALGGKSDGLHGAPLHVRAEVTALSNGRFSPRALLAGVELDLGPMARLRIGGIDVLVSSRRQQTFDDEVFRSHGIDVRRMKIVGLKSAHHFRAGFEGLASAIVTADGPGLTTQRIEVFPRERTPRPIWPLDPEATWSARARP
ncbi:MAG TPA: M81 family metallopeptidase [Myxococcota bacterium]|nr:M81 family metallopeptidase [Myxococcota bacterium]